MAQSHRLASGGRIERDRNMSFSFDGASYTGHPGDTLVSALLANGVRLFGRSFKYHRPRGVWGAGIEEPNALVELRSGARQEPNTRATTVELHDGLVATSQNRWPSLGFDVMAVNSLVSPIFAAGFYYKTFMWPASFWEKIYEPTIRRAAGLGRAARVPDPDRYERSHLFCDVLVIGGGPAGLMAALTAARTGARVALVDEDAEPGGRLLSERLEIDGAPAMRWVSQVLDELRATPQVTILSRTTLFGVFDHGGYGAVERVSDHLAQPAPGSVRQRYWKIVARRAVLAAGAIERPIAFGGNDRPGVMSAAAIRSYVNRWAVAPGRQAVLFTAGDDGWRTLDDLRAAGVEVAAVIDPRTDLPEGFAARARAAGARLLAGGRVRATQGGKYLRVVEAVDANGQVVSFGADLLAVSGGWNPTVALTCHHGGRPVWNSDKVAFVPGALPRGMAVAGAAEGRFGLFECLWSGAEVGRAAADDCGFPGRLPAPPRAEDEPSRVTALFHVAASRGKAFVDFQHDVTASDIALAEREGFRSVEHTKRYTTLGMATDQGKTANVVGLAILAERTGRSIPETGTTMFRPPYTPVSFGAMAGVHVGRELRPTRLSPTHEWSAANGARFVESGAWLRPQWYQRPGEAGWRDSVDREVRAVRTAVGFCDVSTLGKIEVVGPDAAALLDFVYTNTMSAVAVGRMRYGVMLREDGFVFDDGTCARIAPDRFILTTTTANAARVLQHMEFCHQVLRPDLDAGLLSVTDRWAQVAIAGPRSRELVAALLDTPAAADDAALPFMAHTALTVCGGVPARLYRVSYSGERAYELAVSAAYGDAVMAAIAARGEPFGAMPYGTEALGVLRVEKGHPAGNELNGQTTARDLGLGGFLAKRKDYVGRVLQDRPALVDPAWPVLVGIRPVDRTAMLRGGAHFLAPGAQPAIANDLGHVTSVAFSPSLGHMVGLGLLADGKARMGTRVRAYDPVRNGDVEVEVCPPNFIDPQGDRLRG